MRNSRKLLLIDGGVCRLLAILGPALLPIRGQIAILPHDAEGLLSWPRLAIADQAMGTITVSLTDASDKATIALMVDGRHVDVLD